jgi:hypothetical protein
VAGAVVRRVVHRHNNGLNEIVGLDEREGLPPTWVQVTDDNGLPAIIKLLRLTDRYMVYGYDQ